MDSHGERCHLESEAPLVFRINEEVGAGSELVRDVFLERGMIEFQPDVHLEHEWNLWWKGGRYRVSNYTEIRPWQRLNHHPTPKGGMNDITSKDGLLRNMRRMRGVYNSIFDFSPEAYHLPREERVFKQVFSCRQETESTRHNNIWIYKPSDMSRGRGIFVFNELRQLRYGSKSIVQRYIPNPFLISGYKFDLRLYVVVVSYRPLIVYTYNDGLVRFSTERYDLTSLDNVYAHLTNTSINKYGPAYAAKKVGVGKGCKWALSQLRYYLKQNGINDRKLWSDVISIIVLTLLSQASSVPPASNCTEVFGFDIMFDDVLKPWLLEVNFSPAMTNDCAVDTQVKVRMLHSLIDLLGFVPHDGNHGRLVGSRGSGLSRSVSLNSRTRGDKKYRRREKGGVAEGRKRRTRSNPRHIIDDDSWTTDSGFSSATSFRCPSLPSASSCSSSSSSNQHAGFQPATNQKSRHIRGHPVGQSSVDTWRTDPFMDSIAEGSDCSTSSWETPKVTNKSRLPSLTSDPQISSTFRTNRATKLRERNITKERRQMEVRYKRAHPPGASQLRTDMLHASQLTAQYKAMVSRFPAHLRVISESPQRNLSATRVCTADWSDEDEDDQERSSIVGAAGEAENQKHVPSPFYGFQALRPNTSGPRLPPLPPRYGDLQLIFPFNVASRRASALLDEKAIVREVARLLRHRGREVQEGLGLDTSVWDVEEIWPPL